MALVQSPSAPSAAFAITVLDVAPSQAWLLVTGELDIAAKEDLATILTAQEAAGRRSIWIEMSAVTFMDCSCLSVLVGARNHLKAVNGSLHLTNASASVLRLLTLTRLTENLLSH